MTDSHGDGGAPSIRGGTKKFYDYLCEKNTVRGEPQKPQAALMSGKSSGAGSATLGEKSQKIDKLLVNRGFSGFFLESSRGLF